MTRAPRKPEPLQLPVEVDLSQLQVVSEENQQVSFEPSRETAAASAPERRQVGQISGIDDEAEEGNSAKEWKRYDFAVESEDGPSIYHQTKA